MIIVFRKYNLFLSLVLIVMVTLCASIIKKNNQAKDVLAVPSFGKTVMLDAGHGAPDGGAEAPDGTLEKDLNLKITSFLQGFLEQSGTHVLVTREGDSGIFDENAKKIKQMKNSDIKNREKLMNKSDADIFVSIHMNKFPESKYSGPQVFHSKGEDSKRLAKFVQDRLISVLNPPKVREIKQAGSEIYLLKKAEIPAILVECGFISNHEELALLKDEEYQKRVAWAIYCGICDYFVNT